MLVNEKTVCVPSSDVVARDIEGELVIVPLVAGIGDLEDELFTLNETGRAVWDRLDGRRKLGQVISDLEAEYDAPEGEIASDVLGLADELVRRSILVIIDDSSR